MGLVQVTIDQSTNVQHIGTHEWKRDLGGVIIPPSGTAFPSPAVAGEWFFRKDTGIAYRRNDANDAWVAQSAVPTAHTHPGSDITSQVADADTVDGQHATAFAAATHAHAHGSLTGVTADQHHAQAHSISGADHTGSLAHSSLSGITATDHHSNANDPTANQKAALNNAPNALSAGNPVTDKSYVDALVQGLRWLPPVKDRIYTPPGTPTAGDRYLIDGGSPTGDWVGHAGEVAEWTGAAWNFTTPVDGTTTVVQDEDVPYTQTAASAPWTWVISGGGTAVHGNEKHSPSMLTVGGNRSDANLDTLTGGGVTTLHSHASGVFGADYQEQNSEDTSTTTSATMQDKVTLTTEALTGTYRVAFYCEIMTGTANTRHRCRLYNVTDAEEMCFDDTRPSLGSMYTCRSGSKRVTFAGAAKTFKVQFASQNGSATVTIRRARVEIWRVS